MTEEPRRMPLLPRLTISLVAGLLVVGIVTYASFQLYRSSCVIYKQSLTLHSIANLDNALTAYREAKGGFPTTLRELPEGGGARVDEDGAPADSWRRPLRYQVEGSGCRVISFGRDGKPGGAGLDYDLSSDDLREGKSEWDSSRWSPLPSQSRPTFTQFLQDRGEDARTGSGGMMALMSLLSGLAALALAFRVLGGRPNDSKRSVPLVFELLATVAATLIAGVMIAGFHVPSGH